jgi:hypothetical protein
MYYTIWTTFITALQHNFPSTSRAKERPANGSESTVGDEIHRRMSQKMAFLFEKNYIYGSHFHWCNKFMSSYTQAPAVLKQ